MKKTKEQWISEAKAKLNGLTIETSDLFDRLLELRPDLSKSDIADILGVKQISDYTGKRKALPSLTIAVKAAVLLGGKYELNAFIKNENS